MAERAVGTPYEGLFPKTGKSAGAGKGLKSIFDDPEYLQNWKPAAEAPRDYTAGGVWNRAYIDTHGDLPSQLRDAWRRYQESGFYRMRGDDGRWQYRSHIPATFETLRRASPAYQNDPVLQDFLARNDAAGFQQWKDRWEAHGGMVAPQLRGNQHWNRYAHDPAVQAFLDRYAPDPARQSINPAVNIPQVVERLANQQASRVAGAGTAYRGQLDDIAQTLRRRLANEDQDRFRGQREADTYRDNLRRLAQRLSTNINVEDDPGYQLRRTEAIENTRAALAGAGLSQSGAAQRAIAREASELASREYGAADARRRANIQAEAGIRTNAFDRLIAQLNRGSDAFQEREREFSRTRQFGAGAEYQNALQAISQLGLGQGAALDRIIEERDAEVERRDLEYLRGIQNEQRRKAEAEARAAARRARRGKLYSDILGTVGTAAGAFLGGPAGAAFFGGLGKKAGAEAGE